MKTFLFALIAFVTLAVAAPVAQAGQFARVYNGRGVVYVHKSQLYGGNYYGGNYYGHHRHHRHYRGYAYNNYYRPAYYNTGYYRPSYYRTGYYNSSCGHHARPRVAISFGF